MVLGYICIRLTFGKISVRVLLGRYAPSCGAAPDPRKKE